ncbi:acetate/propionate family kinase [Blastopirellula marina]|uniref:Acetate kinase n=1 Tax=Blastopirellula marina DSM 3645 TaxID=314230 RepID=A3ZX46_9BACT|nr:acetate/propionate family kinase [Blastopirellula marina]EAQ78923.1 acetate kinase [Blastopirellula marina DSM 3645]
MDLVNSRILTINGGSSSIKFALFQAVTSLDPLLTGSIERIGLPETRLQVNDSNAQRDVSQSVDASNHAAAVRVLLDWIEQRIGGESLAAVGHRVVHGMQHVTAEQVTPELLVELRRISPCDPQHLPGEIEMIQAFGDRYPTLPQVVCFDTAFHQSMPRVAKLLPIPRRYDAIGVQRYGFHGLSYSYLIQELKRLGDPVATTGRGILAHLGNGASLCAIRDGKSVDTSMGFTPTAGLPMGVRSGDLDPGLVGYLARAENMSAEQFNEMVNSQSGLLGVSESSSDVRDLLEIESTDVRAAEAVALFCYQAKKSIGAYAAVLGGLDTLVFAGGIGENATSIRTRICEGLEFLGLEIDDRRNLASADVISSAASRVTIRVIRTNEEWIIASTVCQVLGIGQNRKCKT